MLSFGKGVNVPVSVTLAYILDAGAMDDNTKYPDVGRDNQRSMQDPDVSLRPEVPMETVLQWIGQLYGIKPCDVKELPSYIDRNFFFNGDLDGTNSHHTTVCQHGYVLKVLNTLQSSMPTIIVAQQAFQEHLRNRGIPSQIPILNKDGKEFSLETVTIRENDATVENGPYIVRILTFIPGDTFFNAPYIPVSFYNVGKFMGKLHKAAKGFHHPFFDRHSHIWSLAEVPAMTDFLYAVKDADNLAVVKELMTAFDKEVKPRITKFAKGIIHGDISEQNLVMYDVPGQDETPRESRIHDVSGILDFGHVTLGCYVFDVAICIAYISIECPDDQQTEVGGHILAGYSKFFNLNEDEMDCLKTLVCCRLCQSLVYGAHAFSQQPWNTYLLTTSARGWPLLHRLWKVDKAELMSAWKSIRSQYLISSSD